MQVSSGLLCIASRNWDPVNLLSVDTLVTVMSVSNKVLCESGVSGFVPASLKLWQASLLDGKMGREPSWQVLSPLLTSYHQL